MISPEFWNQTWTAALVNHLWQSTVATLIAWLLALAMRNNHAKTRYSVWMIASIKFLLPFSLLIAAGERLRSMVATPIQRPAFAATLEQITQPFPQVASPAAGASVSAVPAIASHHPTCCRSSFSWSGCAACLLSCSLGFAGGCRFARLSAHLRG